MGRTLSIILAFLCIGIPYAKADKNIEADPQVIAKGGVVKLVWYFKGDKILLSGGRFGKGLNVNGKTEVTDTPEKTTRYTFNVYYHLLNHTQASSKVVRQNVHVVYSVVVPVVTIPKMLYYHSTTGWKVQYVKGWRKDSVNTGDGIKDGLVFFQPTMDSEERMSIAKVAGGQELSPSVLINKIMAEIPENYTNIKTVSEKEITLLRLSATEYIFTGVDAAGEHTESIVLAFVDQGYGYVLSARSDAGQFELKQIVLRKMLSSFSLS